VRVPEIQLPEGRYFSLTRLIRGKSSGQTRALLTRNRLLAQHAGIEPTLLTFDSWPRYPRVRATLRERGHLVDPMRLLNIFEWYREHDVDDLETVGEALPEVEDCHAVDEAHADGTVYRTRYWNSRTGQEAMQDFRRQDGSVYARVLGGLEKEKEDLTPVTLANSNGEPVAIWPSQAGWHQQWVRELAPPEERTFIICDSRYELPHLLGLSDDQFHVIHLIHNLHLDDRDRRNVAIKPAYLPVLQSIGQLDGLVTLTSRQRDDIAARFGATSNMFVVPNTVGAPPRPDPLPVREAKRFAIVARLEDQKQLEHGIRAFALVLKEEPDAKLDIYGDGEMRTALAKKIDKLGVQDSVVLRGYDPHASDSLWTATGFLLTSRHEGYPLATLESMSHGCPVISYDIKYGPREQISHGVDGYLVKAGDIPGLADRIMELIRDPELVARMSEAAVDKAAQHDYSAFLDNWRTVLEGAIAAKERRTSLESVSLKIARLGYLRPLPLTARVADHGVIARLPRTQSASSAWRRPRKVEFLAELTVDGQSLRSTLDSAVVTLDAVADRSTSIVGLPLEVARSGSTLSLAATADLADVFRQMTRSPPRAVRLRLRLVWENSSWQTTLSRPARTDG
jgi:poly(glycerol-phosphate) alpha-glucosyltransferase